MSILPDKIGYGLEIELSATDEENQSYVFNIANKTPLEIAKNYLPEEFSPEDHLGEEECTHIVEFKSEPHDSTKAAFQCLQNIISNVQNHSGIAFQAHPEPIYPIDSSNPQVLTQRGRELIEQDGAKWLDRLKDTAVCSFQITSSKVLHQLYKKLEHLDDINLKKQFIALFLDTIRIMAEQRPQIDQINNTISGQTSTRLQKIESLLDEAKSSYFPENPEYRYNFQADSIEEYLSFLVEVTFLQSANNNILEAKKAHHIYAKLKFGFNPSEQSNQILTILKSFSYPERVEYLTASNFVTDELLRSMQFIGIEYRPFNATLDPANVENIIDYTTSLEERVLANSSFQNLKVSNALDPQYQLA